MRHDDLDADDASLLHRVVKGHFWLRQSPYALLLLLALAGIGYWSFANEPINGYWMFLAIVSASICIATGWPAATDRATRVRLLLTQGLHWLTILVAMNILLFPNVAEMANADATGQAILLVLALGTLLAGIHIPSWQLVGLGIVMMIGVPALAWLEESALILLLGAIVVGTIGGLIWWRFHKSRTTDALADY